MFLFLLFSGSRFHRDPEVKPQIPIALTQNKVSVRIRDTQGAMRATALRIDAPGCEKCSDRDILNISFGGCGYVSGTGEIKINRGLRMHFL